jgi:hypothetical protein
LLVCHAKYGKEIRDCRANLDCATGTQCTGITEERGTCIATQLDTTGGTCTATAECSSGLVCAGESRGEGICNPAWQRRSFATDPALPIPDNQPAGTTAQLYAYGLATVDTDVWLHLQLTHPRTADLRITLTNPAGASVTVFDSTPGVNIDLAMPVIGFSGDESVNGTWSVHVVDKASTRTGTIDRIELTLGSRWD